MSVTAKKLLAVALGLGTGVGGLVFWQLRSPDRSEQHQPRAVAPATVPSPQIEPVITLPPFSIAVSPEGTKVAATKLEMSLMSEDEAMKGIAVSPQAARGLGLREGRGRFGRMRPPDVGGQIHSATSDRVGEDPAPEILHTEPPAQAEGVLDPENLQQTIKRHRTEVRMCARQPTGGSRFGRLARGKIALRWTVLPDGTPGNIEVAQSTIDDPRVARCVVDNLRHWRFDPPERGTAPAASTFVFQ